MLAPTVWHRSAVSDHAFKAFDFAVHRQLCRASQPFRFLPKRKEIAIAVFGKERDRVCTEQLIVADGRRNRAGARPIGNKAGLRVISAVAAGLECVDTDDLITGQSCGERGPRIGALEVEIIRWTVWHEAELRGSVFEEIG